MFSFLLWIIWFQWTKMKYETAVKKQLTCSCHNFYQKLQILLITCLKCTNFNQTTLLQNLSNAIFVHVIPVPQRITLENWYEITTSRIISSHFSKSFFLQKTALGTASKHFKGLLVEIIPLQKISRTRSLKIALIKNH